MKRILVFGSPNAGKTSMLNKLIGTDSDVSKSEDGSAFKIKQYQPVIINSVAYHFFDVDGISKTKRDKLTFTEVINNINSLLQHSKQGFNLLIFVTRSGTINQSAKDEYSMFSDVITKHQIPILCVVTNCENFEPMSQWVVENEFLFVKNQMHFVKMVGTCFQKGGRFEKSFQPLREESAETVWNSILTTFTEQTIDFITPYGSSSMFAMDIWKNFCTWIGNEIWTEPTPDHMQLLSQRKSNVMNN
ncbi:unnamed protein product [Rotaria socialis]|uniref:G domain-containing protein n=1 Tax=Rotaria socialis TaxID=392032 RepID=A0A821JJI1_9BILA|nr:unnamed protein product [Rotaria socialis]CAF4723310.1 unnamed protein product [Rotaria socialis]